MHLLSNSSHVTIIKSALFHHHHVLSSCSLLSTVTMSSNVSITPTSTTAPTPQNTPLNQAPISFGLVRPGVPDIKEDADAETDDAAPDVASLLRSGAARSIISNIVQNKLNSLVGKSSGYIETLPTDAKRSLSALRAVQEKYAELQRNFSREKWELEKKV